MAAEVKRSPSPAQSMRSARSVKTVTSAAEGETKYVVLYHMDNQAYLIQTSSASSWVAEKVQDLPNNPAKDFKVKRDRESEEFFLSSDALQLSTWAPCPDFACLWMCFSLLDDSLQKRG